MNFFFTETAGNASFTIKVYSTSEIEVYKKFNATTVHCFLDEGSFCFGQPSGALPPGRGLSISTRVHIQARIDSNKLYPLHPAIILQILEILEAIKQDPHLPELETMALAIYSSCCNFLPDSNGIEPINFNEAQKAYAIVQEWKRSPHRIQGSFNDYKPAGMPRYKFLNVINRLYGCSAAQLIYDINMLKAMIMLLTSGKPITTVSELSGYTNKENFITAFRNAYGVTPGYLRKQFR
jgi:hypothetical protein